MGNWNSSMIFASAGLMLKHVWEAAGFIPLASRGDVEVWVWKKVSTSALEHWKDQNKRELRREVILRTFLHFHLQDSSYTEYKHFWLCEPCWFILCSLVSTTGKEKKKKKSCLSAYPVFWSKPSASVSVLRTWFEDWKLLQKGVQYSRRVWHTMGLGEGRWGEGVKQQRISNEIC